MGGEDLTVFLEEGHNGNRHAQTVADKLDVLFELVFARRGEKARLTQSANMGRQIGHSWIVSQMSGSKCAKKNAQWSGKNAERAAGFRRANNFGSGEPCRIRRCLNVAPIVPYDAGQSIEERDSHDDRQEHHLHLV